LVQNLRASGINVTYYDNPSKEKIERINKRLVELRKRNSF